VEKILIAGFGDKLRGDDGLGNFVIEELKKIKLPENVEIEDFGTNVFSLIDRLDKYKKIIIVDAIKKNGNPGKVYKLRLDKIKKEKLISLHEIKVDKIILLKAEKLSNIIFIGCEPKNLDFKLGLSKEVRKAIPKIINLIISNL
jgi:hydrogenase maturation protease